MNKIIACSKLLKYAAVLFAAFLPILEAGYWITSGYPFLAPWFHAEPLPLFAAWPIGWNDLSGEQKLLGFFSNLIPILFSMASLLFLAKLFSSMEKLQLFVGENARNVKKAAWALIFGQLFHPISVACLSLSLTYRNPVGHRNISISIGSHELAMIAIGVALLLLSWILDEASVMNEEQQATV